MEARKSADADQSSGIGCFLLLIDCLVSLCETGVSRCETSRMYLVETPARVLRWI
jgi:hypothetical protein